MNIVRLYNQNRRKVWRIVVIIIFAFIMLKLFNYIAKKNNETQIATNTESNSVQAETEKENKTYTSNTSGVTGSSISKSKLQNAQEVLDAFFKACNNQEFEEAYNMLTDECKELVYPSQEAFESNYYDNVFKGEYKTYTFENWHSDTYYVTIKDDALATGKVSTDDDLLYDYITIKDNKLNISTYIERTTIDKQKTSKDIAINITSKDTFMDYEIYNITLTNNSENTICLTDATSTNDIYIQDENNVKYTVYNHEIAKKQMIIQSGYTKNLSFKFYSSYVSTKNITMLVFSNIILDYDEITNKANSNEVYKYYIDL